MAQLANTPRSETFLRLEARKSFSFAVRLVDENGRPFDLTGASLELAVRRRRDPKNLITNAAADLGVAASSGYARFNLQASDLALAEGEYPFAITLLDDGYSSVLVRGTVEIIDNPAELGATGKYVGGQAATALELTLQGQMITVQAGHIRPPGETAFTDQDREKLDRLDESAEPNVQADWNAGPGTSAYIKNRPLTRLVPKPRTAGQMLMSTGTTDSSFRWVELNGEGGLELTDFYKDPVFTGNVQGITKAHVGLNNVNNTADANKPISNSAQKALDLKAPLASPSFTGTVSGVTKAHVGLGNADNTSDANKPASNPQKALFVPRWSAGTAYVAGQQVITPDNSVASAIASHTAPATFARPAWRVAERNVPFGHMGRTAGFQALAGELVNMLITMNAAQELAGGMIFNAAGSYLQVPEAGRYLVTVKGYWTGAKTGAICSALPQYTNLGTSPHQTTVSGGWTAISKPFVSADVYVSTSHEVVLNAGARVSLAQVGDLSAWGTNGYNGSFLELTYLRPAS